MGVSNQTMNNWFSRGVPGRKILPVAKFLDVRPEWLLTGEGAPLYENQLAEIRRVMDATPEQREEWVKERQQSRPVPSPNAFKYPEITWQQATSPIDPLSMAVDTSVKWHSSDAWAGHRGFWVRVVGSSMASSTHISFPEGTLILIAPGQPPNDGQFVIARLKESDELTFKQLVRDAGDLYLKPLNSSYPMKPLDDSWEIAGTVVDAKLPQTLFT